MRLVIPTLVLITALAPAPPSRAADRNLSVTTFEKIRLEGPFQVSVTTGVAPFARISGSQAGLETVQVAVQGQTLVIRSNRSTWGGYPGKNSGPVTIAVGTHELASAALAGSGALTIDRVKGLNFGASVGGAGSLTIGKAEADRLALTMSGSGTARIGGKAEALTATLVGASMLDGSGLEAESVKLVAEGPAVIRLTATETAQVTAGGTASITIAGNPDCTLKLRGSVHLTGCE